MSRLLVIFAAVALGALPFRAGAEGHQPAAAAVLPQLQLAPCEVAAGARCGIFRIAEDPRRPEGRVLDLKIVVLAARSSHPREPVFILAGGPGQAATPIAAGIADSWVTEEHPAVLMDFRGSGQTSGLDCPSANDDAALDMTPLYSESDAYLRACRDALAKKADLTLYTTPRTVEDLDALRQALGYDRIDLYGASFGTRMAIAYIHAHGDHVRAALLTGLVPMANRSPLFHAQAAEAAFERIVADCAAEAPCHIAFPDIREDFDRVLNRLQQAPARVMIKSPVNGGPLAVNLSAPAFADSVRVMMYSLEGGRKLPLLLHRAAGGALEPFAQAAFESERALRVTLREGLALSTDCPENVARIRPEEIGPATAGSLIGDTRVRHEIAACRLWPHGMLPSSYFAPFQSQTPTVLVSGERDPVSPARWGEEARKTLPNSVHLVGPGGHATVDDCVAGISAEVFRTGSVKGLDTACVTKATVPPFDLP